jgi:plastocyanin
MLRHEIATLSAVTFAAVGLTVALIAANPATTEAGGGCHMDDGSGYTEGPATVVRMDACSFEPTVVRVPVGTNVRFLNTAQNDHAVNGRRNTWGNADILAPGDEFSEQFNVAGIYPYMCPLHPGMVGAVIVGEVGQAGAPVTEVGAEAAPTAADVAAPAAADVATPDRTGSAGIVPAALGGAAGGGAIGLLVGAVLSRNRSSATSAGPARGQALDD